MTVLQIGDELRASQLLQEKTAGPPNLTGLLQTTGKEFKGDGQL